jgi:hypothetical protein
LAIFTVVAIVVASAVISDGLMDTV